MIIINFPHSPKRYLIKMHDNPIHNVKNININPKTNTHIWSPQTQKIKMPLASCNVPNCLVGPLAASLIQILIYKITKENIVSEIHSVSRWHLNIIHITIINTHNPYRCSISNHIVVFWMFLQHPNCPSELFWCSSSILQW